jgi:hypothetical protein
MQQLKLADLPGLGRRYSTHGLTENCKMAAVTGLGKLGKIGRGWRGDGWVASGRLRGLDVEC